MRRLATATVGIVLLAVAAAGGGCRSAPTTGRCDVVYRFENVRREVGAGVGGVGGAGSDEWTEISRILDRYADGPVPMPKTYNFKSLPRGEVRTCEVLVSLPSMADLAKVEADLQGLSAKRQGENRLEFSLSRATMVYRSNFIGADLEVTLRGVTQDGFRVVVFPTVDSEPQATTAGRGGAWSIKLLGVPPDRYVYGYSKDPEGTIRTRFFRIDLTTMRQETVPKTEFEKAIGVDPDRQPRQGRGGGDRPRDRGRPARSVPEASRDDRDWYRDAESDRKWNQRDPR